MFAKGRTNMQVMIDDRAEILQRTLREIPQFIELIFKNIDAEIKEVALAESGEDPEMKLSIQQSLNEMYHCDDRLFMIELINKAIVVMTDSYCESTLKEIAAVKKIKSRKQRGNTDIERLLSRFIVEPQSAEAAFLDKYWPDFVEFHDSRNNIVHENKVKKEYVLNTEYIAKNIESVRNLLRAVEALTLHK